MNHTTPRAPLPRIQRRRFPPVFLALAAATVEDDDDDDDGRGRRWRRRRRSAVQAIQAATSHNHCQEVGCMLVAIFLWNFAWLIWPWVKQNPVTQH